VEALISGRADRSKIYQRRKDSHRSRGVISNNQSTKEDDDLQSNSFRGGPDPSATHEQRTGDNIITIATELSDMYLHRAAARSDHSNVATAGDQAARLAPPQQDVIPRERNEVHGQPLAADGFPTSNTAVSTQALTLVMCIVSVN
jgi:hypothetical protein